MDPLSYQFEKMNLLRAYILEINILKCIFIAVNKTYFVPNYGKFVYIYLFFLIRQSTTELLRSVYIYHVCDIQMSGVYVDLLLAGSL